MYSARLAADRPAGARVAHAPTTTASLRSARCSSTTYSTCSKAIPPALRRTRLDRRQARAARRAPRAERRSREPRAPRGAGRAQLVAERARVLPRLPGKVVRRARAAARVKWTPTPSRCAPGASPTQCFQRRSRLLEDQTGDARPRPAVRDLAVELARSARVEEAAAISTDGVARKIVERRARALPDALPGATSVSSTPPTRRGTSSSDSAAPRTSILRSTSATACGSRGVSTASTWTRAGRW